MAACDPHSVATEEDTASDGSSSTFGSELDSDASSDDTATPIWKARFDRASEHVRRIVGTLDPEALLYFYARYKQVTEGPCNIDKPGFFAFESRKKWEAWKKLGDMSKGDAAREYIEKLASIDTSWEDEPYKKKKRGVSTQPGGAVISTLRNVTDEDEGSETLLDWVKDGNLAKIIDAFNEDQDVNARDEMMTPLHWACDRGCAEVVEFLVNQKHCDINAQDACGQTPLHFASSCNHEDVVRILLKKGASCTIADETGALPKDVAVGATKILLMQDANQ